MGPPQTITSSPAQGQANLSGDNQAPFSDHLLETARVNATTALKELEPRLSGLSAPQARWLERNWTRETPVAPDAPLG